MPAIHATAAPTSASTAMSPPRARSPCGGSYAAPIDTGTLAIHHWEARRSPTPSASREGHGHADPASAALRTSQAAAGRTRTNHCVREAFTNTHCTFRCPDRALREHSTCIRCSFTCDAALPTRRPKVSISSPGPSLASVSVVHRLPRPRGSSSPGRVAAVSCAHTILYISSTWCDSARCVCREGPRDARGSGLLARRYKIPHRRGLITWT